MRERRSGLWQWLIGAQPRPAAARRVLFVASGSPRTGTTVAAGLLARAGAAAGRTVLLVDSHDTLGELFDAPVTTVSARAESSAEPVLRQAADGVTLVSAPAIPPTAGPERTAARACIRRIAALCPRYDMVLVDAGSQLAVLRDLWNGLGGGRRGGCQVVIVTTAEPAAAAPSYALAKVLITRMAATHVDLLVSRAGTDTAAAVYGRFETAVHRFLRRQTRYAGALPDDPALREPVTRGVLRDTLPHALLADADADELLHRMLSLTHAAGPASITTRLSLHETGT